MKRREFIGHGRVVDRYCGRDVAQATAVYMEYQRAEVGLYDLICS